MKNPRIPQPFWRAALACFYVKLGKKFIRLSPDRDEAMRLYHLKMAARPTVAANGTVAELVVKFLAFVETDRPKSYKWYKQFLRSFRAHIGERLTIADLQSDHIEAWIAARYKDDSASCRVGAIRAVSRVFSWADKKKIYNGPNPTKGIDRPRVLPRGDEAYLTPDQIQAVLNALPEDDFKVYVRALILCGARPGELRLAVCEDYNPAKRALVLPPDRTKCFAKTGRQRVIYLDAEAEALVQQAMLKVGKEGRIFRAKNGKPFSQAWANSKFRRLKVPFKVTPYYLRHSFCTSKLQGGMPVAIVAALAGHSIAMCESTYAHVNANDAIMQSHLRGNNPGQDRRLA